MRVCFLLDMSPNRKTLISIYFMKAVMLSGILKASFGNSIC